MFRRGFCRAIVASARQERSRSRYSSSSKHEAGRNDRWTIWAAAGAAMMIGSTAAYFLNPFRISVVRSATSHSDCLQRATPKFSQNNVGFATSDSDEQKEKLAVSQKKKLVILGSGWAAVSMLREIGDDYDVVVVSPRNYFLFTPLLTGVTVGTNDERSVIEPIRRFCRKTGKHNIQFYEAECTAIDTKNSKIVCEDVSPLKGEVSKFELSYDDLVIAVGAQNNTFGTPGVEKNAHFLKTVEDAVTIRSRLMDAFESANYPGVSEEEKKRLLRFVVVGGGPTGVEFAAELHDFLSEDLHKWFPHLEKYASIVLVQSGDHILNTFDQKISEYTESKFKRVGIDILTNKRVKEVKEKEVVIVCNKTKKVESLPYAVCVWNTGIQQRPLVKSLIQTIPEQTHQRALLTDSTLLVKGTKNVYAIGDCSSIELPMLRDHMVELFWKYDVNDDGVISRDEFKSMFADLEGKFPQLQVYKRKAEKLFTDFDENGDGVLTLAEFEHLISQADSTLTTLPATAQVASQQGKYLAKAFNKAAKQPSNSRDPFEYHHAGTLAKIGGADAVAEIGKIKAGGFFTWWMYGAVYLSKQFSLRNHWLVVNDWMKRFIYGRDISRF